MSFPIGEPISNEVATQIAILQNLVNNKTTNNAGTAEIAYYLNSKTPWVKLTSSAFLKEESDVAEFFGKSGQQLAKDNVLFNLNLNQQDSGVPAGYKYTSLYGARPRPGITNMSMHSHNRYGSLRTATVNFTVFDPDQLAIMEVLYMRPGYSVILEFGHSLHIDITKPEIQPQQMQDDEEFERALAEESFDGIFNIDRVLEETTVTATSLGYEVLQTSKGIDFFKEGAEFTSKNIYDLIKIKRAENKYAYDGIYGLVDNFNWSLRPDGGYDCTTRIISRGTVIESLTTNITSTIANIGKSKLEQELETQAAIERTQFATPDTVATQVGPAIPSTQEQEVILQQIELGNSTDPAILEEVQASGFFPESIPDE